MKSGSTTILRNAFAGLEQDALDQLRAVAQRRTYPPQTLLAKQGEVGHVFYVIVSGRVAVIRQQEDGNERLLAVRGPNEFFGEMSLLDEGPRMANCITISEATVLEVTEALFEQLVEESPAIAHTILLRILETARAIDQEAISELNAKNEALQRAYAELKAAQAELVEKERLEREIELAARVQRDLLPSELPCYPGYAFAAYLQPARQVGGDFYDVVHIDDEHVGLLMADVADKGFHAALFMATTRALFAQEGRHTLSPSAVALAVHEGMLNIASSNDIFVTAFYGVLHRPSGELIYVRAGQDRPLLCRPDQPLQPLPGDGRFLGMWSELTLQEYCVQLQPGDRLLLYSDGVPDTVNLDGEQYGIGRLEEALVAAGSLSAATLIDHIVTDIAEWCEGASAYDDVTLLAVEVGAGS